MNKIKANFEGQTIFVGMDIHKASWNLGIHLNDMFVKNVHQKPTPTVMVNYLKRHYPGATYKAAYEAGKFGFWIQRQFTTLGIECLVVNPADIPKSQKDTLQKNMERPYPLQDRIKGVLAFCGIDIPQQYDNANWSHNFINWLKDLDCKQQSRRSALDYMIAQMELLRKELLSISTAIRKMMREQRYKTNYYLLRTIPGIGPLTAASILVESVWTASRTDPAMALYFQDQIKRKDSKIVIIKIARKLLNRIRFVLINQLPYEMGVVK